MNSYGGDFLLNAFKNKKFIFSGLGVLLVIVLAFILFIHPNSVESGQSITMYIHIDQKDHKGEKMWVIGSNAAYDSSENVKMYKVIIKDPRIYNLLEKGKIYFVTLVGIKKYNQSEYNYTFGQLALPNGSRMR